MVKAYSLGSIATRRTSVRRTHRPVYLKICSRCEKEYPTKNKMSEYCSGPCALRSKSIILAGSKNFNSFSTSST